MSVLYAKTMALIKRNQRNVLAGDRMEVSGITLELTAGRAYAGGKEVFLTPKEFSLLRCLMQNKNLVMSREQLLLSLIHIFGAQLIAPHFGEPVMLRAAYTLEQTLKGGDVYKRQVYYGDAV